MKYKKGNTTVMLSIIVVILAGVIAYLLLTRPVPGEKADPLLSSPEQSTETRDAQQSAWAGRLSEIQGIVDVEVEGLKDFNPRPASIFKEVDVTGDGIKEAMVNLGAGGAYTDWIVLMRMERDKPVLVKFQDANGEVSVLTFNVGASARYSVQFNAVSEKRSVYSIEKEVADDGKSLTSCSLKAFTWNKNTNLFEYNQSLVTELKPELCKF